MTTPRDGLGAPEGDPFSGRGLHEALVRDVKWKGLHMIGESPEGRVVSAHVQRIGPLPPETLEAAHMDVAEPRASQELRQCSSTVSDRQNDSLIRIATPPHATHPFRSRLSSSRWK